MNRYLCLHLHFYQPPRENPWLNEIEYQESAYPFHDWNERINMECYRTNGMSRILDAQGRVLDLSNNYARTSFNFGPTLLSWLENKDPKTYEKILEGDKLSQQYFGGHGSAIAQVYNHVIMPLANRRDKETQVKWGIRDFETRFKREAEAMWLAETAVDTETLEVLSEHGMKYVILAPRQAQAVRDLESDGPWQDVTGERVDPREPYLIRLPSGRSIAAFFYDGPISKAVAFEGLLHNGETFAQRLMGGFDERPTSQLLHIATDGETYGHHHRNGDMALAYALWCVQNNQLATITNYGQYLELHPPRREAQIVEGSSWSCEHGVDRWMRDCGCNTGMSPGWHQQWRAPLRRSFDELREDLTEPFEQKMKEFTSDPWAMRNDYIDVIMDRSLGNIERFLKKWCGERPLSDDEMTSVLRMLEAQKNLLFMYTSCAWFFDEVSGVEAVQNLQYAYRALELSESVFSQPLVEKFMQNLRAVPSNIPEVGDAYEVFARYVRPSKVATMDVGIHFAIASAFQSFSHSNEVYNSKVTVIDFKAHSSGKARFVCGHARVRSRTTLNRHHIVFAVVHLGDHNVSAGVKKFVSNESYVEFLEEARQAFGRADFHETLRVLDRHFAGHIYSLKDLFRDERKRVTDLIMRETMADTEDKFGQLYKAHFPLMSYLASAGTPLPEVFIDIAEFVLNRGLRSALSVQSRVDTERVAVLLAEARNWNLRIDMGALTLLLGQALEKRMQDMEKDSLNVERLQEILDLVRLDSQIPLGTNLGLVQNWFFLWYKGHSITEWAPIPGMAALVEELSREIKVKLPDKEIPREYHA